MNGLDLLFTGVIIFIYGVVAFADHEKVTDTNRTRDEVKRFNRMVESARRVESTTLPSILIYGVLLGIIVGFVFGIYIAAGTFCLLTVVEYKVIKYKSSLELIPEEEPTSERK